MRKQKSVENEQIYLTPTETKKMEAEENRGRGERGIPATQYGSSELAQKLSNHGS